MTYGGLCQPSADLQEGGTGLFARLIAALQLRTEGVCVEGGREEARAVRVGLLAVWLGAVAETTVFQAQAGEWLVFKLPYHLADPHAEAMFLVTLDDWGTCSRKVDTHPLCSVARVGLAL